MAIKIYNTLFDPWCELQCFQRETATIAGKFGATSIFIGTMRDFNAEAAIEAMTLEHYPGMTEKCIAAAIQEAEQQWTILDCLVVHRIGDIYPNQPIVLVAVWASHRGDAFDACRYIMETLKSTAPFWKKEFLSTNTNKHSETQVNFENKGALSGTGRWVSRNSDGYAEKNSIKS